jgi:hypothetical protein
MEHESFPTLIEESCFDESVGGHDGGKQVIVET